MKAKDMPFIEPATGDNWPLWIINTFLVIGAAMAAIIGTLVKMVDNKYRAEQEAQTKLMEANKLEALNARAELKAEIKEIRDQHKQCEKDRLELFTRIAILERQSGKDL